jgi:murein DD-endopeptidase MepM/ murein hydrolase activator NlpD
VIEPGVPTPAQTVADGAVFPVAGAHSFGDSENRYGAPRGNHIHEGQDILTAEGTPDVAPLAGTISWTSYQASGAGYYAVEHTAIGFDLVFDHCKAATLLVSADQAVAPGTQICQAGQTGDATAPHLHFEIWVGGWYAPGAHTIDPLPYLEAWEHGG